MASQDSARRNGGASPLVQGAPKSRRAVKGPIKFNTFQGVFTPTLLTILGVIMYLRGPWVVGNAGVLGAIGIITLATVITLFTALLMSSIVTNIRIKAGGAFRSSHSKRLDILETSCLPTLNGSNENALA